MKYLFIALMGIMFFVSCKKEKQPANQENITSDKWTKVSDEFIEWYSDIKIDKDKSIRILSGSKYFILDSNLKTTYKYEDIGSSSITLLCNEFIDESNFFSMTNYNNDSYKFLISFLKLNNGKIFTKTSINEDDLFGSFIKNKRIHSYISSENSPYIAYNYVESFISDSSYIFGLSRYNNSIVSKKIVSYKRPEYKVDQFAKMGNSFVFYRNYGDKILTVDENYNLTEKSFQFTYKTVKQGDKLLFYCGDKILSTKDGLNYSNEMENIDPSSGSINKSANDSLLVITSSKINLINLNNKTQKYIDTKGLSNYHNQEPCFVYFNKLVMFTYDGIYTRLIE